MKEEFPVYEFRPINKEGRKLLRYNSGNWVEDDGEYDLAFMTDDKGTPMVYGISLPYYNNILWSWCRNMQWSAYVATHPRGNAWHYMTKDGNVSWGDRWEKDKHPNEKAVREGRDKQSSKRGASNGRLIEFHVDDEHIWEGLVRNFDTKEVLSIPKIFKCIYCGNKELIKEDQLIRELFKKLNKELK